MTRTVVFVLALLAAGPSLAQQVPPEELRELQRQRDAAKDAHDDAALKRDVLAARLKKAKVSLAEVTREVAKLEANLSWLTSKSLYSARTLQKKEADEVARLRQLLDSRVATIDALRLPLIRALWANYHALFEAAGEPGPGQAIYAKRAAVDLDLIGRLEELDAFEGHERRGEIEVAPIDPHAPVEDLRLNQLAYEQLINDAEERLFILRPYAREHGLVVQRLSKLEARLPTKRLQDMLAREQARLARITNGITLAQRAVAAYQSEIGRVQLRIDELIEQGRD